MRHEEGNLAGKKGGEQFPMMIRREGSYSFAFLCPRSVAPHSITVAGDGRMQLPITPCRTGRSSDYRHATCIEGIKDKC